MVPLRRLPHVERGLADDAEAAFDVERDRSRVVRKNPEPDGPTDMRREAGPHELLGDPPPVPLRRDVESTNLNGRLRRSGGSWNGWRQRAYLELCISHQLPLEFRDECAPIGGSDLHRLDLGPKVSCDIRFEVDGRRRRPIRLA